MDERDIGRRELPAVPRYTVEPMPSATYLRSLHPLDNRGDTFGHRRTFDTMAAALDYAKSVAHRIAERFPGDGGKHFPVVIGPNGEEVPYSILTY